VAIVQRQAARVSRQTSDGLPLAGLRVDDLQFAPARIQHPQPAGMPAWRVRHRQAVGDDLVRRYVDQHAAVSLAWLPAPRRVAAPECRDEARLAIDHGQPVEVATIFGGEGGDEGGRQRGMKL
jgi:hypothetical protein